MRKTAKKTLQVSERRYRAFLRASPLPGVIYRLIHNADGAIADLEIVAANALGADTLGLATQAAIGKRLQEVCSTEGIALFLEAVRQVAATGQPQQFETQCQPAGGHYLVSVFPVDAEHCGTFTLEITERKKTEESLRQAYAELESRAEARAAELSQANRALRESEGHYRTLLETAPDAIVLVDLDGTLLMANAHAAKLFGYATPADMVGLNGWVPHAAEPGQSASMTLRKMIEAGEVRQTEYTFRRKDGSTFWAEASASPVRNAEGQAQALVGVLRDITERRQAEALKEEHDQVLMQLEILRQVDELRSDLIANVSHEIRTPLGLILFIVTALQNKNLRLDDATLHSFLQDIEEETHRLERIVEDLLDASRLEKGRLTPHQRAVDLWPMVRRVLSNFGSWSPGHRFQTHGPSPETALTVWADAGQVEQVLRNLLDNAVKYSPPGTTVTVEAQDSQTAVQIAVRDEGPGIPAAEHERIFERFYRRVDSNAPTIPGLGLGLYICRGIVEAHGGQLWVESSSSGCGSTFTFTLPKVEAEMTHGAD